MPYIKQIDRNKFPLEALLKCVEQRGLTPGELNYLVTRLSKSYVDCKGLSYTHINDVLGALEGAKQEFYRRVAVNYEQEKIEENGDVYSDHNSYQDLPITTAKETLNNLRVVLNELQLATKNLETEIE